MGKIRVAVVGCVHGQVADMYDRVGDLERSSGQKIDLVLCCGDFQAVREWADLQSMACPAKYRHLGQFVSYHRGENQAPWPTVFIGGNHEASNVLQAHALGGWLAPNIYYLGLAGVLRFGGLRLAGLSGIYNARDFTSGHHERPPYGPSALRSVFHVRAFEVYRFLNMSRGSVDVMMSHDWPQHVARFGNLPQLLRWKPFLRNEIADGSLGSPPARLLMEHLQPTHWFSAHMHVRYEAAVAHEDTGRVTRFLALDKVLPRRLCVECVDLDVPEDRASPARVLELDPTWLAVLRATAAQFPTALGDAGLPNPQNRDAAPMVRPEQLQWVEEHVKDLTLPSWDEFAAGRVVVDGRASTPASYLADLLHIQHPFLETSISDTSSGLEIFT